MFLINGVEDEMISVADRSVRFGDGCFTTARVVDGEIAWLPLHLQRLKQAVERLLFPAVDWGKLEQEMCIMTQQLEQGVIKAILTRGSGGKGYSINGCLDPVRIISLSEYPQHYLSWRTHGVSLILSIIPLARSPLFAGIKHLNRLEQVLIRTHLEQTAADEALVLDTEGMLVECSAANLFWRKGMTVFTPDLTHSGVAGIMRQRIIELLSSSMYRLHFVSAPLATLADADEVIICNALMPLVPVNDAHGWVYNSRQLYQFLSPHCLK